MKKQIIKGTIAVLFLGLISYYSYRILTVKAFKETVSEQTKNLPSFEFYTVGDSIPFTKTDIPTDKVILVHFNTECDFCNEEVKDFKSKVEKLNGVNVLLVSSQSQEVLQQFKKEQQLSEKNFTILQAKGDDFYNMFGTNTTPTAFVYHKQKLKGKHSGLAKLEVYLRHFENN